MKLERTQKQIIGSFGEDIASRFFVGKGFAVVDRNYRKKFGEIDIILKKIDKLHFVEVKTVSCDNLEETRGAPADSFRPEDNIHPWKLKRLARTIQVYLSEHDKNQESDWQFDVATVFLDMKTRKARVKILEDVIL